MTDKIYAYTVILDREYREPQDEMITNAIRMIKGVAEVTPLVADADIYFATETARRELSDKLWQVLRPKQ